MSTTSPAMDILKSSNVERVLFDLFGLQRTRELMQQLDEDQCYQLDTAETEKIQGIFAADYCSDDEGLAYIQQTFEAGYLMDPHTATCFKSWELDTPKTLATIVYSTAEWTKFSPVINQAITGHAGDPDQIALESVAQAAGIKVPEVIRALFNKPVCHDTVIDKGEIEDEVIRFVG